MQASARPLTVGEPARTAGVGVETMRYEQRRVLPPTPSRARGGWRTFGAAQIVRLRFIRRAQELGFSLDEIAELLRLADASVRRLTTACARRIAQTRPAQVRAWRDDLDRIARVLVHRITRANSRAGGRSARSSRA